jgi:hypothetical protein
MYCFLSPSVTTHDESKGFLFLNPIHTHINQVTYWKRDFHKNTHQSYDVLQLYTQLFSDAVCRCQFIRTALYNFAATE